MYLLLCLTLVWTPASACCSFRSSTTGNRTWEYSPIPERKAHLTTIDFRPPLKKYDMFWFAGYVPFTCSCFLVTSLWHVLVSWWRHYSTVLAAGDIIAVRFIRLESSASSADDVRGSKVVPYHSSTRLPKVALVSQYVASEWLLF